MKTNKEKKSIIDEALLDVKRIEEALEANTKEILRSVAKEEIEGIVESALKEDDYDEEDVDLEAGETSDDYEDSDVAADSESGTETDVDVVAPVAADVDVTAGDQGGEESEMDYDSEMDMTGASDEDVIAVYKKMSGDDEIEIVSDNEIHIKPVGGDEYIIKLDGGAPEIDSAEELGATDMGGEGDEMGMEDSEMSPDIEGSESDEDMYESENGKENVVYEITLEEEAISEDKVRTAKSDIHMGKDSKAPNAGEIDDQKSPEDKDTSGDNLEGGFDEKNPNKSKDGHADHVMEGDVTEEEETEGEEMDENKSKAKPDLHANRVRPKGKKEYGTAPVGRGVSEAELQEKYELLAGKYNKLIRENEDFKGILKKFRKMLAETVVFNSNLTYVTKLFLEHTTTKEEKEKILERFDSDVANLKESQKMYKTIKRELETKKPISESVETKINIEKSSSVSGKLNESTVYIDKETTRIKDLMNRVEKR